MSDFDKSELDEYKEKVKNDARKYYKEGLNCSECVFKSYLDLKTTDFPPEVVALSSGFGGGIGMTKNTCGAILGAVLSVATIKGRKNPLLKETPEERIDELNSEDGIYIIFNKLVNEFKDNYGTILCRELTEQYSDWHSNGRKKYCQEIIGYASTLAVKYALSDN